MRLPLFLIPALFAALSACTEFPELDATVDSEARAARYPNLVPIENLKEDIPDDQIKPETDEELEDRVDALKSRAGRLKGKVLDRATQKRMKAGIEPVSQ